MPKATAPAINPKDIIEGLGKGLRVIEAFDDDHPRLTASQAATRAEITRTAARRHLLSLVHFGYAASDGKQFWLAPRVLRLGQSYLGAARLPRLVQPFIQRISNACGETVNVSVLDGHEMVYIARSSSPRWVSIGYQVGVRAPAHVVTPGIVMLSALPDADVERWIKEHHFVAFTSHTVTDPKQFRAQLRVARAQQYWTTEQQLDPGLRGIALALVDRKGVCRAAIGMTVQATSYDNAEMVEKLLPHLRDAAATLRPLL
jgi:IclR family transcriptional regulator, pca regulon regulatory protein